MLLSRGVPLLRKALRTPSKNIPVHLVKNPVRNLGTGFRYRNVGEAGSEFQEKATDWAFTFFWFWVCYHSITKYDHIIGEYDYPDPLAWTDEELGVPPDDYEPSTIRA